MGYALLGIGLVIVLMVVAVGYEAARRAKSPRVAPARKRD